jgi:hypothetical protein
MATEKRRGGQGNWPQQKDRRAAAQHRKAVDEHASRPDATRTEAIAPTAITAFLRSPPVRCVGVLRALPLATLGSALGGWGFELHPGSANVNPARMATGCFWLYFNVGFFGRLIPRTPPNGAERTSRF